MRLTIPVTPDAETAREWAREELARPEYREQGSNWFEDFVEWVRSLFDGLGGLGSGLGVNGLVVVAILAAALVALLLWLVLGPMRRSRRAARRQSVFDDDRRSAEQMLGAARAAAATEDWDLAVVEQFRALVRRLEERGALPELPGATAEEAAHTIASLPPGHERVRADASAFAVARYGNGGLTAEHWEHIDGTWQDVMAGRTAGARA